MDSNLSRIASGAASRPYGDSRRPKCQIRAQGRLSGKSKTKFRLVGQLNLTYTYKNTREVAWGSLKARDRPSINKEVVP